MRPENEMGKCYECLVAVYLLLLVRVLLQYPGDEARDRVPPHRPQFGLGDGGSSGGQGILCARREMGGTARERAVMRKVFLERLGHA